MDFNAHVGYNILGMVDGCYALELDLREHHLNQFGYVHGGVLFTMLDTAMSRACFEALPPGKREGVTLEIKINFLKTVSEGRLKANGELVNLTKRTAYVEGHICNENGVLVAKASGTVFMPEPR